MDSAVGGRVDQACIVHIKNTIIAKPTEHLWSPSGQVSITGFKDGAIIEGSL